jgi:four helix bundle protein
MKYQDLEIWQLAHHLAVDIHELTLLKIPKFEFYETGSQIRRSSKSVKSNIVEGFGRRHYKKDFIHFLIIAQASLDETRDHLDTLYATKSLSDIKEYNKLSALIDELGRKLFNFIRSVRNGHLSGP